LSKSYLHEANKYNVYRTFILSSIEVRDLNAKLTDYSQAKETIIDIVKTQKPRTTKELVQLTIEKTGLPEQNITNLILQLENENRLKFTTQTNQPTDIKQYIKSKKAIWFWITIALSVSTVAAVFSIGEEAYPLTYVRQILGIIFVLFLPGYAFIKLLFPSKMPVIFNANIEIMDNIERIALSLGMSLALVPMVGLILNYTPWGIRLAPITISLLSLTLIFAAAAVIREYQTNTTLTPDS
jgi:hypothetical protein